VNRGRREGAFRHDVPVQWLLTVYFVLVQAAGREFANGASTASQAKRSVLLTLLSTFGAPAH
jgi:hypothetical protein